MQLLLKQPGVEKTHQHRDYINGTIPIICNFFVSAILNGHRLVYKLLNASMKASNFIHDNEPQDLPMNKQVRVRIRYTVYYAWLVVYIVCHL